MTAVAMHLAVVQVTGLHAKLPHLPWVLQLVVLVACPVGRQTQAALDTACTAVHKCVFWNCRCCPGHGAGSPLLSK